MISLIILGEQIASQEHLMTQDILHLTAMMTLIHTTSNLRKKMMMLLTGNQRTLSKRKLRRNLKTQSKKKMMK